MHAAQAHRLGSASQLSDQTARHVATTGACNNAEAQHGFLERSAHVTRLITEGVETLWELHAAAEHQRARTAFPLLETQVWPLVCAMMRGGRHAQAEALPCFC